MKVIILLKDIRESKGLSLRQLADMTGISKSHLNNIELNRKEPTISMLVKIALALEVDIKELYKVKE